MSIYWFDDPDVPKWIISISCLYLSIKFISFLRAFEPFGVYFAIIFGVFYRIRSFFIILVLIIASFALSFHNLLIPKDPNALSNPDPNDPNNPWSISGKFNPISGNGTIDPKSSLIQVPEENTNSFTSFFTSLFATYLFLTGDSSSFTQWSPTAGNATVTILMVLFSSFVVIYLMNLLIGVLNIAIEKDIDRATYLVQKAEILAEIELFYPFPFQRRWKRWFPEVIHYRVRIDVVRESVKKAIIDGNWKTDDYPEYKNKVLRLLGMFSHIEEDDKTLFRYN